MKKYLLLVLSAASLICTGCASSRKTVNLTVPSAAGYPFPRGAVSLGQIDDTRVFVAQADEPSKPAIIGDGTRLGPDGKALLIGLQRTGCGICVGDVTLPEGRPAAVVARELLAESLRRRGYAVGEGSDKTVDVEVNQFWAWYTPGTSAVSFEARIQCTLTVRSPKDSKAVVIQGQGLSFGQFADAVSWRQVYAGAFEDFLANASKKFETVGL